MMFDSMKEVIDKNKAFGTLTPSLKAFDCFNQELFIAKLHTHDLKLSFLKLLQDYLSNNK